MPLILQHEPTLVDSNPHQELSYFPFVVIKIAVMEVVVLLMIHLVKYVFKTKQEM